MRRRLFDVIDVLRPMSSSREEAERQAAEELSRAMSTAEPTDDEPVEPERPHAPATASEDTAGGTETLRARPWAATGDEPAGEPDVLQEDALDEDAAEPVPVASAAAKTVTRRRKR